MTWRDFPTEDLSVRPIKDGLHRIAEKLGVGSMNSLTEIQNNWDAIVGLDVAAYAEPTELRQTTLVIIVSQQRWVTQLRWMSPQMITKINELVPSASIDVLDIRPTPGTRSAR